MTKRELNQIKEYISGEFEFIREKNNSGVTLWGELNDFRRDVAADCDRSIVKKKLTWDEVDAVWEFWCEQLEQNISLTVREK